MAIVLKYGPPGPILQSGFAAGVGSRKNKQQEDLLRIWQQQTQQGFQAQQAAIDRQQREALQVAGFGFQADRDAQQQHTQILRDEQLQKSHLLQDAWKRLGVEKGIDARANESELRRDQAILLQKNQQEAIRHQKNVEGVQKGEMELPGKAQQLLKELEDGRVESLGPGYTDAQREQFMADYEARKRALYGTATLTAQTTPQEEFGKSTFEKDGTLYQKTDKGFDVLKEAPDLAKQQEKMQAEQQKRQQEITSDAKKLLSEKNDDGKPVYKSFGEALKEADSMRREADSFFAPAATQTPAAPPQAPNAAPPEQGQMEHGEPVASEQAPTKNGFAYNPPPPRSGVNPIYVDEYNRGSYEPGPGKTLLKQKYSPEAIQESLKRFPNMTPEVAAGVTPELVKTMADHGSQDPVRGAIAYHSLTKDGSLTTPDKSQQTMYPPEKRKAILEDSQLPRPSSKEEMDALPKGAAFVAPDGTIRRKP